MRHAPCAVVNCCIWGADLLLACVHDCNGCLRHGCNACLARMMNDSRSQPQPVRPLLGPSMLWHAYMASMSCHPYSACMPYIYIYIYTSCTRCHRYLDLLVGPLPAADATYAARSPLEHADSFTSPVIFFQGTCTCVYTSTHGCVMHLGIACMWRAPTWPAGMLC